MYTYKITLVSKRVRIYFPVRQETTSTSQNSISSPLEIPSPYRPVSAAPYNMVDMYYVMYLCIYIYIYIWYTIHLYTYTICIYISIIIINNGIVHLYTYYQAWNNGTSHI